MHSVTITNLNTCYYIWKSARPLHTPAFLFLRDFLLLQGTGISPASASGSLLYGTFWTVWERSILLSSAVKQLAQLLVQAAIVVNT